MKPNHLSQMVRELNEVHGLPYRVIAESAGCDVSTVYRIRDGLITDPSYSIGKAIDDLVAARQEAEAA